MLLEKMKLKSNLCLSKSDVLCRDEMIYITLFSAIECLPVRSTNGKQLLAESVRRQMRKMFSQKSTSTACSSRGSQILTGTGDLHKQGGTV